MIFALLTMARTSAVGQTETFAGGVCLSVFHYPKETHGVKDLFLRSDLGRLYLSYYQKTGDRS